MKELKNIDNMKFSIAGAFFNGMNIAILLVHNIERTIMEVLPDCVGMESTLVTYCKSNIKKVFG